MMALKYSIDIRDFWKASGRRAEWLFDKSVGRMGT